MNTESNQMLKLSYQDLCTIQNALRAYRMYLYEDYDNEDDYTLKYRIHANISSVDRIIVKISNFRGYYGI